MGYHAKLSPSSAHRWMACPGSVHLIGNEPNAAGMPAMMGTAAHKIIETMIQNGEIDATEYHGYIILVQKVGVEEAEIYASDDPTAMQPRDGWFAFVCDDAMVSGVQMFIDEVERVKELLLFPEVYAERFLDMSWLDPRLGGTADVTLVEEFAWIDLFDYKNGRVIVEVEDNEQMKNYAVGLLHEHPDCVGVRVHLIQPNAQHEDGAIRPPVEYTADEIRLFEIVLKDAAEATTPSNAPRRAGEWCTYCPANTRCPEFDALAFNEAGADFAEDPYTLPVPDPLPDTDGFGRKTEEEDHAEYRANLARKARWIPLLDSWTKNLRANIMAELINKQDVPGWKLVRGRSNRAYIMDEDSTVQYMIANDIPFEYIYAKPKLKSPAQIEKLAIPGMNKAAIKAIVAPLVHKPEGKLAIALLNDAREAVEASTAEMDFATDPIEGDDGDFE
jgi:Protein of unknown function (DUF2800)